MMVSVTIYKPIVPVGQLERHRELLEEMLNSIDVDTRISLDDRDYDVAAELIKQLHAVAISIDVISAEIARCKT